MATHGDRLVRRIQERLRIADSLRGSAGLAPTGVAELQARVRRIRALGECFADVRLSSYVTGGGSAVDTTVRVGGECVATEV
jgi:hypothetical protein